MYLFRAFHAPPPPPPQKHPKKGLFSGVPKWPKNPKSASLSTPQGTGKNVLITPVTKTPKSRQKHDE